MSAGADPHAGSPVVALGPALSRAHPVLVLLHGRNAGPENIVEVWHRLERPDVTCLAPAAAGRTWYPLTFLAPREANEPALTSALARVAAVVDLALAAGVPRSRIVLGGFSQGACLAAEFVYRHPGRYGGLFVFSGGLIGPPGTTWDDDLSLNGTRVFFGCSDIDAHIPKARVEESAAAFERAGAQVTLRLYPGMGHLVNDDEIVEAGEIVDAVAGAVA